MPVGLRAAVLIAGVCGLVLAAAAQSSTPDSPPAGASAKPAEAGATNAPAATNALATTNAPAEEASTNSAPATTTNGTPPVVVEDTGGELLFNFHGAPLSTVLEYMSDAAGFIINNEGEPPTGKVEIWSKKPVTKDEAVDLLDGVLRKNKYAVSRNDRILTIYKMQSAKTSPDFPVRQVSRWEDVEDNDDVGTFVVPVHYVSATQLKMNLQVLLPLDTDLEVNESANSLVMVAPGRDVRRALKIINALDTSVANNSLIRVFKLKYADAKALATEITALFTQNTQGGGLGGFGGRAAAFMALMRGGGGGGGGGSQTPPPSGTRVAATSDDYSNSLIVNAAVETMTLIEGMVKEVDSATTDLTELKVFPLKYADPNQLADQINQMFPDTSRTDQGVNPFGFRFGGFGGFRGGMNQATTGTRDKKMSQVLAVPEPRTRCIMVSAASQLMPHIEELIKTVDISARHEKVSVFDLANADPQDVQQILQDLFQRSGNIRASSTASRSSLLGTANPLTQRATQSQLNTSSTSGFGGSGSRGGGLGGGGGL